MLGSSGALIASHIDDVQTTGGPLVTGISEAGEDGRTFQASTGAGSEDEDTGMFGAHQLAVGELGSKGTGLGCSWALGGGGGRSGTKNPWICCLTSKLPPHKSSPAPSSSIPSKAIASVRKTYLLTV